MTAIVASNKPSRVQLCDDCKNEMPITRTTCPHCGRPQLFPNVSLAKDSVEKKKLIDRYNRALSAAAKRDCAQVALRFDEVCTQTTAVFTCPLERLHRETATGTELYETYYDLERLRLRTSSSQNFDWEKLRPQAEIELLGSNKHLDQLHYACLSIDGNGLSSYGECAVRLAEPMIAHRASCFEGNTAVIYAKKRDLSTCIRCDWGDRNKICVAVCSDRISQSTNEADFPGILLALGVQPDEDQFIEVHIFGPMTCRTFHSVRIDTAGHSPRQKTYRDAIAEKLAKIPVEIITS